MTRVIMLRHGQSEANAAHITAGQINFQLTDVGREQAKYAADHLFLNEKIDRIYSSDLQRAIDTAAPTAELFGLSITTDRRLREIDTGKFAGLTFEQRVERFPAESDLHARDFSHMQFPDGEYVPDAYDRVVECVCEIAKRHDGETVLIASHAGAIRVFDTFAQGYSREESGKCRGVKNASVSIYECDGQSARPIKTNITDHLPDTEKQ